ncbi:MAG: hypothetical protein WC070_04635 [Candidatus Magasanikbacteria bacterium]
MKKIIYALFISFIILIGLFFLFYKQIPKEWETITTTFCSLHGGSMIESGCGIANCDSKCVVPYSDGGKVCSDSTQCSHDCIVNSAQLPSPFFDQGTQKEIENGLAKLQQCIKKSENIYDCSAMNLSGSCEKREPANCEHRWKLDNGVITAIFAECTM